MPAVWQLFLEHYHITNIYAFTISYSHTSCVFWQFCVLCYGNGHLFMLIALNLVVPPNYEYQLYHIFTSCQCNENTYWSRVQLFFLHQKNYNSLTLKIWETVNWIFQTHDFPLLIHWRNLTRFVNKGNSTTKLSMEQ